MTRKQSRVPEGTKCCVCKTKPYAGFYRVYERDGTLLPVCSKLCGVHGGYMEKPIRKYVQRRPPAYVASDTAIAI